MTPSELKERIARLQKPLTYLEGGISLYAGAATYTAMFSMDRCKRISSYFVRPDLDLRKKVLPEPQFYAQLNAIIGFEFVTPQDRIGPDLLARKNKPETRKFTDDAAYEESERQRLSDLTLEHNVPILRYELRWEQDGSEEKFAGALLATQQQQFIFELANKG
ncbi:MULTISPECIES: hypothetical protein [unclassified Rhizobium]|uniref:hypothetical protein n=1 Tax=unclassified Rhizobium TaxID=2613769 RepID=UPI000BC92E79|nr:MULTISPECIES: hypothetical protein [unclassified Rhizobium]MDH7804913.1 hypothetical protein [Rhizobium sp. AN67]MDQ4406533.1 hypothetical protein [Rhizobium sp. AN63]SOD56242.1 hypothetical protein SAMN05216595_2973 [Rhizobium sp. AN6A]